MILKSKGVAYAVKSWGEHTLYASNVNLLVVYKLLAMRYEGRASRCLNLGAGDASKDD